MTAAVTVPDVFAIGGRIRGYAWGSTTAIPQLLGIPPDGRPAAELWFGAHPAEPSPALGTTLEALLATDPAALLGPAVVAEFGPQLPFLLKVLAAATPLSIQVHPTRAQAEEGYAAEDARGVPLDAPERNYRDRNHKPELLCALTQVEALCGFRPVADTLRLLDALDLPALDPVRSRLAGPDGLRSAFTFLLSRPDPKPLSEAVAARGASLDGEWAGVGGALTHAAAHFPGDAGVLVALLLNHVVLRPGEAIYLGAGNVHAYLRGTGVEIMANSDNVLRCGLTGKHVDVAELLRVTDFSELPEPRWPSTAPSVGGVQFDLPTPDFALLGVDLDAYRKPGRAAGSCVVSMNSGPQLVLCASGTVEVSRNGACVPLSAGHAAFVTAGAQPFTLRGTGWSYVAGVGGQS